MPLNGNLEAESIYISLNTRPNLGEYVRNHEPCAACSSVTDHAKHWGLILVDSHGVPVLHHASNRIGPWAVEERKADPDRSISLIAVILVDRVKRHSRTTDIIRSIPADGSPSQRTGESFTCRTWVKDVLVALHEYEEIMLPTDIGKFSISGNVIYVWY